MPKFYAENFYSKKNKNTFINYHLKKFSNYTGKPRKKKVIGIQYPVLIKWDLEIYWLEPVIPNTKV